MQIRILLILMAVLLLVGCNEPDAKKKIIAVSPQSYQTLIPTQTSTLTSEPTTTSNSSPTATLSASPTPTPTTSPAPTWVVDLITTSTSADGNWLAELWRQSEQDKDTRIVSLEVTHSSGTKWIAEVLHTNEFYYFYAWPFHWSKDGEFFYFTHRDAISDGCFGFKDSNGSDLWQLNLVTGQVKEIVPKVGGWLALSPDETRLAYLSYWPPQIIVRDFETGEDKTADLEILKEYPHLITYGSHLIWSPDGKYLAFTMELDVCGEIIRPPHSIVLVNANSLEQRTIVSEDERSFFSETWDDASYIILKDFDENTWKLSVLDGEVEALP